MYISSCPSSKSTITHLGQLARQPQVASTIVNITIKVRVISLITAIQGSVSDLIHHEEIDELKGLETMV